jgi:hypothetical protein
MANWTDSVDQWDILKNPPKVAGSTSVAPLSAGYTGQAPTSVVGLQQGWTPDYRSLILGDPSYLSWKNNATLDVNQAAAARKAALQRLAVQYGGLPSGFKDQYGDIGQDTLDLAGRNQFSTTARLAKIYAESVEGDKRRLAARGALQSGDLGYALSQSDYARGASEYDAGQQFSNVAQEAVNGYVGAESAARRAESDALARAESNVYLNPMNRPVAATSASLDPDWQSKYGVPVYSGPDGKLYQLGPDGNPIPYSPVLNTAERNDWASEVGLNLGQEWGNYSPGVSSADLARLYGTELW